MIRDEHIEAAIKKGILTAEQAGKLRALAVERDASGARADIAIRDVGLVHDPDDERFRLIGGFNDVFVTIGVVLLVAGLFWLSQVLGIMPSFPVLCMLTAWGLSEFFARRLRLALPSIVLALMFSFGAGYGGALVGERILPDHPMLPIALATLAGAALHELRFRVPINWAIGATAIAFVLTSLAEIVAPEFVEHAWYLIFSVCGLGIFAVAFKIDASDVGRETRRSDIAFWLHLVAAPMIVHAVIPLFLGSLNSMGLVQALGALAIYLVLGVVALVVDRRALLVSGLLYAGLAIGYLIGQSATKDVGPALTLLALAAVVLGLSAGWRPLRRALVPLIPLGTLKSSIPPPQ